MQFAIHNKTQTQLETANLKNFAQYYTIENLVSSKQKQ